MSHAKAKETELFISSNSENKIQYNYSKLVGRIVEKYGTRENYAKAFGCSSEHLSKFLNNKWFLKQPGIDRMCSLLDISENDIYYYFFDKIVQ